VEEAMYKGWDGNWQSRLDGGQHILTFYMMFVFLDYTNTLLGNVS
jgi:hypothetical protein